MSKRGRRRKRKQRLQSVTPASGLAPTRPSSPAGEGRSLLNRNRGWLAALGLLIGVALVGYVGIAALARPPLTLTVLHTNDTWGYLRPCG